MHRLRKEFKQHVSFTKEDERITVKVYRCKCPFCDVLMKMPTPDDIRSALTQREMQENS